VCIPNPHEGDISTDLLTRILKQAGWVRRRRALRRNDRSDRRDHDPVVMHPAAYPFGTARSSVSVVFLFGASRPLGPGRRGFYSRSCK
jgi:hypothetical protein